MKTGAHLNRGGIKHILKIKEEMNTRRDYNNSSEPDLLGDGDPPHTGLAIRRTQEIKGLVGTSITKRRFSTKTNPGSAWKR